MPTREVQASFALRPDSLDALRLRFDELERTAGARALAVAVYDTETRASFRRHAERWSRLQAPRTGSAPRSLRYDGLTL